MAWCAACGRYWTPTSLGAQGSATACPSCGGGLEVAERDRPMAPVDLDLDEAPQDEKVPWHFKLLVVAVVGYLGWRAVELVVWLFERL